MGKLINLTLGPILTWIIQMRQEQALRRNLNYDVASYCDCSAHDITVPGMAHAVDCPMAD